MVIFILFFFIYLFTAVPVIFFEDNPEFITTAYTLGIAHPPGYPLVNMLGSLAGFLPVGGFAFRCNLLSSFFGALSVYFLYRCALCVAGDRRVAFAAALLFGISGSLWTQAAAFEVYTLHYAFFFGILWLALSGRLADFRFLLISVFLFGLGVTNHLSMALALAPFAILWAAEKNGWRYRMNFLNWIIVLGAGTLSWGVQLYLPARSFSSDPAIFFSWSNIDSLDLFVNYITGAIYAEMPFNTGSAAERIGLFRDYLKSAMPFWQWAAAAVMFSVGFIKMVKTLPSHAAAFAAGIALFTAYSMIQTAALDIMLVIPFGLILIVASCGMAGTDELYRKTAALFVTVGALFMLITHYPFYDRFYEYSAYDYMADVFDSLPEDGRLELAPGNESNYIFLYGLYGPPQLVESVKNREGGEYVPYLFAGKMTPNGFGLLNSAVVNLPENGQEKVWDHIRSIPPAYSHGRPEPESPPLARSVFKAMVLSRVALQRAYSHIGEGNPDMAAELFRAAAQEYDEEVIRDSIIRGFWGDRDTARMMLESVRDVRPSPRVSWLLMELDKEKGKN